MNILNDIKPWIASSSTGFSLVLGGASSAYPFYCARQPPSTADMVVLYQYGGMMPMILGEGMIDNPRLQVKVMSCTSADLGYNMAQLIQNRLRFVANTYLPTTTGNYYLSIYPLQAPESLGEDETGRTVWVQNFQVTVSY